MARIETWFEQDLQELVAVRMLTGNLFSLDNQGNLIGVKVFDGGTPATLSGTVSGNVILPNGGTVAVTGTLSGNQAYIILPQAAYVPGVITIAIKLTSSGVITTLAAVSAVVYRTSTDTTVDPGTIIPSIQTLINQINTAVASIPADYSSLWTTLAPAFSTSTAYTAGQYVTYSGAMYRFTKAHAAGSWASGDVTAVNIGAELTDLKSALDADEYTLKKTIEDAFDGGDVNLYAGLYFKSGSVHNYGYDQPYQDNKTIYSQPLPVNGEIKYTVKTGYKMSITSFVDINDPSTGQSAFLTGSGTYTPTGNYFAAQVRKSDDSAFHAGDQPKDVAFIYTTEENKISKNLFSMMKQGVIIKAVSDSNPAFQINTINHTVVFASSIYLIYGNERIDISSASITYSTSGTGNRMIVYDTVNQICKDIPYTSYTFDYICIFQLIRSNIAKGIDVFVPYSIDGTLMNQESFKMAFLNLAGSKSDPVVAFDTVNHKYKFIADSYMTYKDQMIQLKNKEVTYATSGSSVRMAVYDPSDSSVQDIAYTAYNDKYIVIFTYLRNALTNGLSLNKQYTVDGVMYGAVGEKIEITLDSDMTSPVAFNGADVIIHGNGYSIDLGEHVVTDFSGFVSGIYRKAYSAAPNSTIYKVFVSHELNPTSGTSRPYYTVTIWGYNEDDFRKSFILTPKLTEQEVLATDNSFTYDGTNLIFHISDTSDINELVINSESVGLKIENGSIVCDNLKVLFSGNNGAYINNSKYDIRNCEFGYVLSSNGFYAQYSSGDLYNCKAYRCNSDGFNYHYGNNNNLFGCSGRYNEDDGVSHHETASTFVIIGGEYDHNGKAGVASPTYGSKGEVHGCYIHDNERYGVLAAFSDQGLTSSDENILVFDCVIDGNPIGIETRGHNIVTKGNVFKNNTTNMHYIGSGEFIEY